MQDQFLRMTLQQLQEQYRMINLPNTGQICRETLLTRLKLWTTWSALPHADLNFECKKHALPIADAQGSYDSQRLLETLVMHRMTVPAMVSDGFPVQGIDDEEVLYQVVSECERYESASLSMIRDAYKDLGFSDHEFADWAEMSQRLKHVAVWNALPLAELRRECRNRRIDLRDARLDAAKERDTLLQLLYVDLCPSVLLHEAFLRRFDSRDTVSEVASQYSTFRKMTLAQLRDQCKEWCMPVDATPDSADKEDYLNKILLVIQWLWLPAQELEKECKEYGVSLGRFNLLASDNEKREEIVNLLVASWNGVPVDRLDSVEAAMDISQLFHAFQAMTTEEAERQCTDSHMPLQSGAHRDEYLIRLRCAALWSALPLSELENECKEWHIPTRMVHHGGDEDTMRQQMAELLLFSLNGLPIERFDSAEDAREVARNFVAFQTMTIEQLNDQCKERNMPVFPTEMPRENCLQTLRYVALLCGLPVSELEKECKESCISLSELPKNGDACEQREHMLDLLLFNACRESFAAAGVPVHRVTSLKSASFLQDTLKHVDHEDIIQLRGRFASMGLSFNSLPSQELVSRLKQVYIWRTMPLPELRRECLEYNVHVSYKEGDQEELVTRLAKKYFGSSNCKTSQQVRQGAVTGHGQESQPWGSWHQQLTRVSPGIPGCNPRQVCGPTGAPHPKWFHTRSHAFGQRAHISSPASYVGEASHCQPRSRGISREVSSPQLALQECVVAAGATRTDAAATWPRTPLRGASPQLASQQAALPQAGPPQTSASSISCSLDGLDPGTHAIFDFEHLDAVEIVEAPVIVTPYAKTSQETALPIATEAQSDVDESFSKCVDFCEYFDIADANESMVMEQAVRDQMAMSQANEVEIEAGKHPEDTCFDFDQLDGKVAEVRKPVRQLEAADVVVGCKALGDAITMEQVGCVELAKCMEADEASGATEDSSNVQGMVVAEGAKERDGTDAITMGRVAPVKLAKCMAVDKASRVKEVSGNVQGMSVAEGAKERDGTDAITIEPVVGIELRKCMEANKASGVKGVSVNVQGMSVAESAKESDGTDAITMEPVVCVELAKCMEADKASGVTDDSGNVQVMAVAESEKERDGTDAITMEPVACVELAECMEADKASGVTDDSGNVQVMAVAESEKERDGTDAITMEPVACVELAECMEADKASGVTDDSGNVQGMAVAESEKESDGTNTITTEPVACVELAECKEADEASGVTEDSRNIQGRVVAEGAKEKEGMGPTTMEPVACVELAKCTESDEASGVTQDSVSFQSMAVAQGAQERDSTDAITMEPVACTELAECMEADVASCVTEDSANVKGISVADGAKEGDGTRGARDAPIGSAEATSALATKIGAESEGRVTESFAYSLLSPSWGASHRLRVGTLAAVMRGAGAVRGAAEFEAVSAVPLEYEVLVSPGVSVNDFPSAEAPIIGTLRRGEVMYGYPGGVWVRLSDPLGANYGRPLWALSHGIENRLRPFLLPRWAHLSVRQELSLHTLTVEWPGLQIAGVTYSVRCHYKGGRGGQGASGQEELSGEPRVTFPGIPFNVKVKLLVTARVRSAADGSLDIRLSGLWFEFDMASPEIGAAICMGGS